MFIISNFIDSTNNVKKRKEFFVEEIPNTVNIYSRLMKGFNLSNQLINYYELNRKIIKWWK